MKDLSVKEQRFIKHWLDCGNGTEAVKLAGYEVVNDNVAANLAWRLLRKAKIQISVKEELAVAGLTPAFRYSRLRTLIGGLDSRTALKALELAWKLDGSLNTQTPNPQAAGGQTSFKIVRE